MSADMAAIFLDTETTQKTDTPECPLEVIELGWREAAPLGVSASFIRRYKPKHPPALGAVAVHGILMSELEGCPPSHHAPQDVPKAQYWIGHNIDFDWKALGSPPVRRICTLALARSLWPDCDSHTLAAMTYFTQGLTPVTRVRLKNAHSALHDCDLAADLLSAMEPHLKWESLEDLYEMSELARIPKKWTFGKFIGQPIGAADRGYASWCARQPDFDPYVIIALRRAGLLR